MRQLLSTLPGIFLCAVISAQSYTPAQADSLFKTKNWNETIKAYTNLLSSGNAQRPAGAWYRVGFAYYSLKDYNNTVAALKKSVSFNPNPTIMFGVATAFNMAGMKDSCYAWIQNAIDKGYSQYDEMVADNDLASIRNEEKYKMLLQKVKAKAYPCSAAPEYRQFDFWIGEWSVFDTKSKQPAGKSKVELILGECVLMENWQPTAGMAGKSFNIYNAAEKKWRQTYVDASGTLSEFYDGEFKDNVMRLSLKSAEIGKKSRLSFYKISDTEVRQVGESSTDGGNNWNIDYDLTYRKK